MSFGSWNVEEESEPTEVIYEAEYESTEDPPMDEWSSLIIEEPEVNRKKLLQEEGLYDPGSNEICDKYIAMSNSEMFRHPYFNYPVVQDPGIKQALFDLEPRISCANDGQDVYIALCKEMGLCPVKKFFRSLLDDVIDLRYYCVNARGVRAMAMALKFNRTVKVLCLMDNFLNDDACFHLGEMLMYNSCIEELNLSGCRIGAEGAKRLLSGLSINRTLREVNLERNQLGDDGVSHIAEAVYQGMDVQQISLRSNSFGMKAAKMLADAFETNSDLVIIDLSWNNLFTPEGTYNLLTKLGEINTLQEVYLSHNSLAGGRIGTAIKNLMCAPNLKYLDLSNNRLTDEAITIFLNTLSKAQNLQTLDLSFNPLSPQDALRILQKMKLTSVKIQNLIMENVFVNAAFLELLQQIKELEFRNLFSVTYGDVISGFTPVGPDMRELVLNRAEFLAKKSKKRPVDIALIALQLLKDKAQIINANDFRTAVKAACTRLDDDLIEGIVNAFSGTRTTKAKTIDLKLLTDYIQRKWPERKLPPTPPPEVEDKCIKSKTKKHKGKKKIKKVKKR